jgi:uncharacterized BrkB/YihY/UPF0761 family membrane protein
VVLPCLYIDLEGNRPASSRRSWIRIVVSPARLPWQNPPPDPTRQLITGSIVGGVAWLALLGAGGYLVGHNLKHASEVYGFFAVVLGLLCWLYLGAQLTLYAAEVNVVRARRLWPRSRCSPRSPNPTSTF